MTMLKTMMDWKIICSFFFFYIYIYIYNVSVKIYFLNWLRTRYTGLKAIFYFSAQQYQPWWDNPRKWTSNLPVSTRRRFDVHTTSIMLKWRRMDVKTTSCVYWAILVQFLYLDMIWQSINWYLNNWWFLNPHSRGIGLRCFNLCH